MRRLLLAMVAAAAMVLACESVPVAPDDGPTPHLPPPEWPHLVDNDTCTVRD